MAYDNQCGSCVNFEDGRTDTAYDTSNPSYVKGFCTWYRAYYFPNDSCSIHYQPRGGSSSNCYITTMLCNRLGLEDDCEELETLRKFRNEVLQKNIEYQELLYEYDTVGPVLAQHLQEEDISIIKKIFETYIKPVIGFLKIGQNEAAISKYVEMTTSLEEYYGINDEQIVPKNYDYSHGGHGKVMVKE